MGMLRFAAMMNPFHARYFIWIDAGFFRAPAFFESTRAFFASGDGHARQLRELDDDRMLYADATFGQLRGNVCSIALSHSTSIAAGSNYLGGPMFMGTARAVHRFADVYYATFYGAYRARLKHV